MKGGQKSDSLLIRASVLALLPFTTSPVFAESESLSEQTSSSNARNLDFSSNQATVVAHKSGTILIGGQLDSNGQITGASSMSVTRGMLLTPAQNAALWQSNMGTQHLLISDTTSNYGAAIGGTAQISSHWASNVSSLVVPQNVAVNLVGFGNSNPINVSGSSNILGSLFATQNQPDLTSTLNFANNLNIGAGALLSGSLPNNLAGLSVVGLFSSLNLNLNVLGNFTNNGTVAVPGDLNLNVGGTLTNATLANVGVNGGATAASITAQNLNIASNTVLNSGLMSVVNNLTITGAMPSNVLEVNNSSGVISALNGAIALSNLSNINLTGGILEGQTITLVSDQGVQVYADKVNGPLNAFGRGISVHSADSLTVNTVLSAGGAVRLSVDQGNLTVAENGLVYAVDGDIDITNNSPLGSITLGANSVVYTLVPKEFDGGDVRISIAAPENSIENTLGGSNVITTGSGVVTSSGAVVGEGIADGSALFVGLDRNVSLHANNGTITIGRQALVVADPPSTVFIVTSAFTTGDPNTPDPAKYVFYQWDYFNFGNYIVYDVPVLEAYDLAPSGLGYILKPGAVAAAPTPPNSNKTNFVFSSINSILSNTHGALAEYAFFNTKKTGIQGLVTAFGTGAGAAPSSVPPPISPSEPSPSKAPIQPVLAGPATISIAAAQQATSPLPGQGPITPLDTLPVIPIVPISDHDANQDPQPGPAPEASPRQEPGEANPDEGLAGVATSVQIPTTTAGEDLGNAAKVALGAATIAAALPELAAVLTGEIAGTAVVTIIGAGADVLSGGAQIYQGVKGAQGDTKSADQAGKVSDVAGNFSTVAGVIQDIGNLSMSNSIKSGVTKIAEQIGEAIGAGGAEPYKNPLIPAPQLGPIPSKLPLPAIPSLPTPQNGPQLMPGFTSTQQPPLKPTNTSNELGNIMNGLINHFNSPTSSLFVDHNYISRMRTEYLPVSFTTSAELPKFSSGCVAQSKDAKIELPGGSLSIKRGSVVAFAYSDSGVAILNLHDNGGGDVVFQIGKKKVVLFPGHELVLAEGKSNVVGQLQPISQLAIRRPEVLASIGNVKLCASEFSIPSCAKEVPPVRSVFVSRAVENQKIVNKVLKTAAALHLLTAKAGPYSSSSK